LPWVFVVEFDFGGVVRPQDAGDYELIEQALWA
jgi:hypothetical protein